MKHDLTERAVRGHWRRILGTGVAALVLAIGIAACGSSGDESESEGKSASEPITVGLLTADLENAAFVEQNELFEEMITESGGKAKVGVYNGDPVKELQITEDWINSGSVDAITGSIFTDGFQSGLEFASANKMPVVLVGSVPEKPLEEGQSTITVDFIEYGETGGEILAKCVNDRLGGKAKVAVLTVPGHADAHVNERFEGQEDALMKGAPGAEIVAEQPGEEEELKSYQAVQTMLLAQPGINTVISLADGASLGALKALKEAGKSSSELCLVGMNASATGLAALKAGDFYGVVHQNQDLIHSIAFEAIQALVADFGDPKYSEQAIVVPDYFEAQYK